MRARNGLASLIVAALVIATAGTAEAQRPSPPQWAPADKASIHPGIRTSTEDSACTANFVFYDDADLYIGQAAHCASEGGATEADGCNTEVLPLGTPVELAGATRPGVIVYSSWVTMQAIGESDENICLNNDFALVKIDRADHGRVNPSMPAWGGPAGSEERATSGEAVYGYGSSVATFTTALAPLRGVVMGTEDGGWAHMVYNVRPDLPGDSGSGFLGSSGGALGILQGKSLLGSVFAGSAFVIDLNHAVAYMRAHTDLDDLRLARGTERFSPGP